MRERLVAAAVAAALALAALPAGAQDRTGVTDDKILIGVPGPFTGDNASFSKAQLGILAYYNKVNEEGGVHGRKIEAIRGDYACNEAKGIAVAKKLIHQDKVFMLHGNSCSGVALAMKPTVVEAGIPWVVGHAVNQKIADPPEKNIFQVVPSSYAAGVAVALRPLVGVRHDDATPQVLQIKAAKPDWVMAVLYEPEMAIFLRDAQKYALNVPIMGTYGADLENTAKRVGNMQAMKDVYMLHMFQDTIEGPRLKPWADMIKKSFPDEQLTQFSFASIGSAVVVHEVLKRAGRDLTREKFLAEMEKLKDFDTGILAGKVSFSLESHSSPADSAAAAYVDGKVTIFEAWDKKF
jgi:branched-chain amino acid transport system substrate-binding protein